MELNKVAESLTKNEITILKSLSKTQDFNKLLSQTKLKEEELNVSIGLLKRNNYIKLGKEVEITKQGKDFLKENLVEKLLKSLPQELEKLSSKEKELIKELKTRKQIIIPELVKERTIELTDQGKRLSKLDIKTDLLETLTPEMLMKGNWKN